FNSCKGSVHIAFLSRLVFYLTRDETDLFISRLYVPQIERVLPSRAVSSLSCAETYPNSFACVNTGSTRFFPRTFLSAMGQLVVESEFADKS
ncbi:MAG TPA: hypothetical protein VMO00_19380, partial [Methylomirabilota bacterium]|nr:hypothetical protein [Methylomirabilota bacterium]